MSDDVHANMRNGVALVRQGRLSTMAAPEKFVEWMRARYPRQRFEPY